jgi:predicted N-acetyltransferase YhbS
LVVHNLRTAKEFVKESDFVAIYNNETVGNIVYAQATVVGNGVAHTVLTFGPVSVLPEYQNKGIGGKLINHTITLAKETGYKCIIIYGDPEYYKRFGFKASKEYGITNRDKKYPAALLVLELYPGALNGVEGVFDEGKAYEMNGEEAAQFNKTFPAKEKEYSKIQDRFKELAGQYL